MQNHQKKEEQEVLVQGQIQVNREVHLKTNPQIIAKAKDLKRKTLILIIRIEKEVLTLILEMIISEVNKKINLMIEVKEDLEEE